MQASAEAKASPKDFAKFSDDKPVPPLDSTFGETGVLANGPGSCAIPCCSHQEITSAQESSPVSFSGNGM